MRNGVHHHQAMTARELDGRATLRRAAAFEGRALPCKHAMSDAACRPASFKASRCFMTRPRFRH